jgi:cell wall-associated NlpC family hydrolase
MGGPTISDHAHSPTLRLPFLLSLLLGLLALLVPASAAFAAPEDVAQAKVEAQQLRNEIESLNNKVEISVERYNDAQYRLGKTKKAIEVNQAKLDRSQKDLAKASDRLQERVRGIYRNGRTSFLDALFTSRSFSELINRLDLMGKIGTQDSQVLDQVGQYRDEVAAQKAKLAQDRQEQKQLVAEAKAASAEVQTQLAAQRDALRGKEAQIAQLQREEEQRQARLAALARQAAAQARSQQVARRSGGGGSSGGSGASSSNHSGGSSSGESADTSSHSAPSPSAGGSVVDVAMNYLGSPYRWGGSSPSGFDCSGFTMYVYSQVGISLPHSSSAQYGSGTHVSRSELQPGDLVFFGSPIHHVGMYVGDGNMIESPYTGASVRIRGIDRSDYAGATRI